MASPSAFYAPIKLDSVKDKKDFSKLREDILDKNFNYLKDLQKEIIEELVQKTLSEPTDVLLDITTGFGKSYIQIVYADILEDYGIDYCIVLPERLIEQFESSIKDIIKENKKAESIRKKIKSHKNFIEDGEYKNRNSSQSIIIIDEIDEMLMPKNELYNKRLFTLFNSKNCSLVLSTATATAALYNHHKQTEKTVFGFFKKKNTKNKIKNTYIRSVSHAQKLKCFERRDNYITQKRPSSLMARINRKSRLLPYIILNLITTSAIISVKIYFNTVAVHLMKDYLISVNLYNFYFYVFLINPMAGLVSLLIAWIFVISPVNFLINLIANRNVISIFLANLEDHHFSSPAYDNLFDSNETFVFHEDKKFSLTTDCKSKKTTFSPYEISRIQQMIYSPKAMKQLIMAEDPEIHKNIFFAFCEDGERRISQNGKQKALFTTFKKLVLGKDLGTQYDHSSFEETQRVACKLEYRKAAYLAAKTYGVPIEDLCKDVDFSDGRQYIKYIAMHGIINNALLVILNINNKIFSIDSHLIHNQDYEKDIKESIQELSKKYTLDRDLGKIKESIKSYLRYTEEKSSEESDEPLFQEEKIIDAILGVIKLLIIEGKNEEVLYPIIFNRNTDKKLHDMMEKGDNYQILDDISDYYHNEITPLNNNQAIKKEKFKKFLKEFFLEEKTVESCDVDKIICIIEKRKKEDLFDFFEKNNLFKKINENNNIYKLNFLREICDILSIQFTKSHNTDLSLRTIDLKEGKKLFKKNLLGILVDTDMKLATGFNDKNLCNGSVLSNNKYGLDPRLVEQAKGRLRGINEAIPGFFRIITNNKTTTDYAGTNCEKLFKPTRTNVKLTIENLPNTFTEQIIQSIEPSEKELNLKKILEITRENFEILHNLTNHDITKSKEKFTKTLDISIQYLSNYGSKIKNSNSIHGLYFIPYCLFYYFIKILYYSWTGFDYLAFYISTIGVKDDTKNFSVEEQIYIHVIKNYKIEECVRDYQIIRDMHLLVQKSGTKYGKESEEHKKLLKDFMDTSLCKKALSSVFKLKEEFITVILDKLQPSESSKKPIALLKLEYDTFLNRNHANLPKDFENTLATLRDIAKEILTLHAWYHDSCTELILDKPLLMSKKLDSTSIFYYRNVGNPFRFMGSIFQLFHDKDAVTYRNNFGKIPRVVALYLNKWLIFIVIIPQIPYLFLVISEASALSTIICAFFVIFIRYSSKIREFLFNNTDMVCNELKVIANSSLITKVEKEVSKELNHINNRIKNTLNTNSSNRSEREKFSLSEKDVENGTYSSGVHKFFVQEIEQPYVLEQKQTIG